MCSFLITPSILLYMLHILFAMWEQPGGNQSGKTWSLDLDDAAQRWAVLPSISLEQRVGGWMGKRHHLKVCEYECVSLLRGEVCWRGEELYKWGTVLASLEWQRLRWWGQGDKSATANSKTDQVMEKGGVEERETKRLREAQGGHECLGNSGKSRLSSSDIQSTSRVAWTSVAELRLAVKSQTETAWTDIRGHVPSHYTGPVIESKLKPVLQ